MEYPLFCEMMTFPDVVPKKKKKKENRRKRGDWR